MMKVLSVGILWLLSQVALAQVQEVVALAPAAQGGLVQAGCYQKIELAVSLQAALQADITSGALNPYDPRDLDLTADLYPADTSQHQPAQPALLGYYTERFRTDADGQAVGAPLPSAHPWRLRFTVARPGRYRLVLHCRVRQSAAPPADFAAGLLFVATAAAAAEHGPLGFPAGQPFLEFADGKGFFAVGENLAGYAGSSQFAPTGVKKTHQNTYPPYAVRAYRQVFEAMRANRANFARIMLVPSSFEFEWAEAGNYRAGQNRAQDLDALLALAEQNGIYIQLSAFPSGASLNRSISNDPSQNDYLWAHHPYRQLPGVTLPIDLFRLPGDGCQPNQLAEQLFRNKLRYLLARWGYSPHLAVVELFNEFDNLGDDPTLAPHGFYWTHSADCHDPNYLYIERLQARLAAQVRAWCPRMLVTSSPATYFAGEQFYKDSAVSFVSYHFYNDLQNYSQLASYVTAYEHARYGKPVQWGEYGFGGSWYHARNLADFRNPLWSSAFSGSFGAGLYFWSWGALHHNWPVGPQGVIYFQALGRFFADEDLACQPYQPLRTPLVPERAAPRPCLPGGVGPPECLDPAQANRNRPDANADSTRAVPATLLPSDPRLEAYALHNEARVLGWVHQREEYWYNLPHNNDPNHQKNYSHPDSTGQVHSGDQLRRYVSDLRGATLRVPDLRPEARYRLEWWQTLGAGGPRPGYTRLIQTDADGTAVLPVPALVAPDAVGNAPDYAFKLVALP